jgi:hypothetical protein
MVLPAFSSSLKPIRVGFLTGWINNAYFANKDRLGDFHDTTLWVSFIRLLVLFDNVDTFNCHFILTWVDGYYRTGLAFVFTLTDHDGVALL